jgi:hypothetical protein
MLYTTVQTDGILSSPHSDEFRSELWDPMHPQLLSGNYRRHSSARSRGRLGAELAGRINNTVPYVYDTSVVIDKRYGIKVHRKSFLGGQ